MKTDREWVEIKPGDQDGIKLNPDGTFSLSFITFDQGSLLQQTIIQISGKIMVVDKEAGVGEELIITSHCPNKLSEHGTRVFRFDGTKWFEAKKRGDIQPS